MMRAGLRLDMQNSSQERRRNSAPEGWRNSAGGLAQQRAATTQTPRRPIGAGGGRGASRSGSASVITTHALFARKVQRKLSNGVAGFAAGGSSLDQRVREGAGCWPPARAAYHWRRSSNANGLRGQNSAGFPQISATFQRDNL